MARDVKRAGLTHLNPTRTDLGLHEPARLGLCFKRTWEAKSPSIHQARRQTHVTCIFFLIYIYIYILLIKKINNKLIYNILFNIYTYFFI